MTAADQVLNTAVTDGRAGAFKFCGLPFTRENDLFDFFAGLINNPSDTLFKHFELFVRTVKRQAVLNLI